MKRSNDNWERLVAAVLRKEQIWELFHAQSPSVLSEASDVSSSFRSSSALEDVAFDFSIPGSSSRYQKQPESAIAKSRNPGLVLMDGVWPAFGLEDLLRAPAEYLGKGIFGTSYTTKLDSRTTVVMKRVKMYGLTEQDFKRRMEVVGYVRHPNVAALRAYFTSVEEKLMLYDHLSGPSLCELLHGKVALSPALAHVDWETRVRIAIGAARGISHIHTQNGGKLVHGKIKASNIFLNSECYGCVSDLGLANMTSAMLTLFARCYAPEVSSNENVSQASDVYSFGILLLQLLTRKSPVMYSDGRGPVDLVKLVNSVYRRELKNKVFDRDLMLNPTIREEMVSMLKIGLICVAKSPKKRPTMSAVVKMIEDLHMMSTRNQNGMNQISIETERDKLVYFGFGNHTFHLSGLLGASAKVIEKGVYGTTYKSILANGTIVSVKRLGNIIVTSQQFQQLIEDIGRMGHQNVAELRAYYYSKDEKLLIYDYYAQDSVSTMLHGNRVSGRTVLDWKTRLEISVGAGRGIAHIHTRNGGKLVHGNIKTSNLFLNEQQHVVVTHVGLASLMPPVRPVQWGEGDCAPDFLETGKVSQACDVYSFGVVLLELVSGKSRKSLSTNIEDIPLVRWIMSVSREEWTDQVIDSELLRYGNDEEAIVLVLQLAMDCISRNPENRPQMADVVKRLEEISGTETEG